MSDENEQYGNPHASPGRCGRCQKTNVPIEWIFDDWHCEDCTKAMSADDDRAAMSTEYRVLMRHPSPHDTMTPLVTEWPNRKDAEEYAELERADYPHYEVWIESREVTEWTKVDEKEHAE